MSGKADPWRCVRTDPAWNAPGVGRFARIADPQGSPIELWEPDARR